MHIDQFIRSRKINLAEESAKLKRLLYENGNFLDSFIVLLAKYFRRLPIHDNMIYLEELVYNNFFSIGEDIEDFSFVFETIGSLLNQLSACLIQDNLYYEYESSYTIIFDYMNTTLSKLGLEFCERNDDALGQLIIVVRKDFLMDQAIVKSEDTNLQENIYLYSQVTLKGNIDRKKEILRNIIHSISPIYQSNSFKERYGNLTNDISELANNFDLRHNNKRGKDENKTYKKIKNSELEELYDAIYRLCLQIIVLNDYLPVAKTIADIKKKYPITK